MSIWPGYPSQEGAGLMGCIEEGKVSIKVDRALLPSEKLHSMAGALLSGMPQTAEILTNIAIEVADLERKVGADETLTH